MPRKPNTTNNSYNDPLQKALHGLMENKSVTQEKMSKRGNRPFENALGDRIRKAREAKGETQLEMANALGLAQRASIDQWESGTRFIKAWQLAEIAQHLGVSADYLLGVTEAATTDRDHRFACDYTGLSQGAVDKLKEMRDRGDKISLRVISGLLSSNIVETELSKMCDEIDLHTRKSNSVIGCEGVKK